MRVAIIQPSYLPWRGYFDIIDEVDLFLFFDDVLYPRGRNWRNRNLIKTSAGRKWLTVPIRHGQSSRTIAETRIDDTQDWRSRHLNQIFNAYRRAPHFARFEAGLAEALASPETSISRLDIHLTKWVMATLDIDTPVVETSSLAASGTKTDRLIELLTRVGATSYLSGPTAADYIDPVKFAVAGIELVYKVYDYAPYPQLGDGFAAEVSILDLLFNCGPDARRHLKSRSPARPAS